MLQNKPATTWDTEQATTTQERGDASGPARAAGGSGDPPLGSTSFVADPGTGLPRSMPAGTNPTMAADMASEAPAKGPDAPGLEAEQVVWQGRYALKNFLGRLIFWSLCSLVWLYMAYATWGAEQRHPHWVVPTSLLGVALAVIWLALVVRIIQARLGHAHELTNRRLFVATGLFRRRRDQLELIRVKDVFERQSLVERWLGVGTVVVVPSETELPTFYLAGIPDPKRVMDLVWHCARAEREGKSVQVENL